jgi:hypothetical protein
VDRIIWVNNDIDNDIERYMIGKLKGTDFVKCNSSHPFFEEESIIQKNEIMENSNPVSFQNKLNY